MFIVGTEGMSTEQVRLELERGARFVVYPYCISPILTTFKSTSMVYFVRAGRSRFLRGLPYLFISAVFGWWGIPHGPICTVQAIGINWRGGIDVTDTILPDLLESVDSSTALQPE